MRTISWNFKKSALALGLSIAAMTGLVNGQAQSLTSVNKEKSPHESNLKDSVKDTKAGVAQLIATMLKRGSDGNISGTLAAIIGLPKSMPMKRQEIVVSQNGSNHEIRGCFVIYDNADSSAPKGEEKHAACAYIVKIKRTGLDKEMRYFRIDLNGNLEKAILSQSKYDESGEIVRGSGVKTDQDIDSPEVRKTFEAEMKFWLKDWLKKEQKNAAKKTANAATPPPAATPL